MKTPKQDYLNNIELFRKLGKLKKIENLAKNQIVSMHEHGSIFYSYSTLIGVFVDGHLYLTEYHDYSRTTSKWCSLWSGYDTRTRRYLLKTKKATLIRDESLLF